MRLQERQKTGNHSDQERSHMELSVRHFGYSRSSGLAPGRVSVSVSVSVYLFSLFRWRHRFQIASFSPSTLENSVFKKHRFRIAPLWRAFSNDSVFGNRFLRCSVDDSRIRSKTAPFSFENGLVWMGPRSFHVVVLQRTAKKCNKIQNARAQPLFCLVSLPLPLPSWFAKTP